MWQRESSLSRGCGLRQRVIGRVGARVGARVRGKVSRERTIFPLASATAAFFALEEGFAVFLGVAADGCAAGAGVGFLCRFGRVKVDGEGAGASWWGGRGGRRVVEGEDIECGGGLSCPGLDVDRVGGRGGWGRGDGHDVYLGAGWAQV